MLPFSRRVPLPFATQKNFVIVSVAEEERLLRFLFLCVVVVVVVMMVMCVLYVFTNGGG